MTVSIDISENGLILNGTAVTLPCDISVISDILGEPVRTTFGKIESDLFDEEALEQLNSETADRACYTWNELGIHCHSDDGVTVNTVSLRMRDSKLMKHPAYFASAMFSGAFTINGKPWLEQLKSADTGLDCTELILGDYSVYASHADYKKHIFNKAAKYSVIELALEEYYDDDDIDDHGDLFSPVNKA